LRLYFPKSKTFEDLHLLSHFSMISVDRLKQAYDFLLGLRIEMHLFCERRMDILENSFQHSIAKKLGFTDAALLVEKFFRSVKDIKVFISAFIEKNPGGEGFFWNLRNSCLPTS